MRSVLAQRQSRTPVKTRARHTRPVMHRILGYQALATTCIGRTDTVVLCPLIPRALAATRPGNTPTGAPSTLEDVPQTRVARFPNRLRSPPETRSAHSGTSTFRFLRPVLNLPPSMCLRRLPSPSGLCPRRAPDTPEQEHSDSLGFLCAGSLESHASPPHLPNAPRQAPPPNPPLATCHYWPRWSGPPSLRRAP